jgi:hypothetical protein
MVYNRRNRDTRDFYVPSSSTKATFMKRALVNKPITMHSGLTTTNNAFLASTGSGGVALDGKPAQSTRPSWRTSNVGHIDTPRRNRDTRDFYVPSSSTKTTFMKRALVKEPIQTTPLVQSGLIPTNNAFLASTGSGGVVLAVPQVQSVTLTNNAFLASTLTEKGSRCLVLDGKSAQSTRALWKTGNVGHIDIPNYSGTYESLARLDKRYEAVHVHPVSVYDFVTSLPVFTKYNTIYLDARVHFTTDRDDDLEATLSLVLQKRLLVHDGTIGITVSNSGSPHQWPKLLAFIKARGCNVTHTQTNVSVMYVFFKLPTFSDGVFTPVGTKIVKCDVCNKTLVPYAMSYFRKAIDHNMCCTCYNSLVEKK